MYIDTHKKRNLSYILSQVVFRTILTLQIDNGKHFS